MGVFTITNIKQGVYKVFALKDNDLNYMYSQDVEKIGFPVDSLVLNARNAAPIKQDTAILKNDTLRRKADSIAAANSGLTIRLFDPRLPLKMKNKDVDKYGVAKIQFNQESKDASLTFDNVGQKAFTEVSKDSILVWYNQSDETPWNIYVKGEDRTDTVRMRPRGRVDFMKKNKFSTPTEIKSLFKQTHS